MQYSPAVSFALRSAIIKWDAVPGAATPTLFSGERLSFSGELRSSGERLRFSGQLRVRPAARIDLSKLLKMHGVIYTDDGAQITRGAPAAIHSYLLADDTTLAGQGMRIGHADGFVGFSGGHDGAFVGFLRAAEAPRASEQ